MVPGTAAIPAGCIAVLQGSAINQDGRSSSLTAPNGPSQTALVKAALAVSNLVPQQLALVSVHGTGTQLGDPIEVGAIGQALAQARAEGLHKVALVSNKSCFGHTEGAAGDAHSRISPCIWDGMTRGQWMYRPRLQPHHSPDAW